MGRLTVGDIVLIDFPYSDLTSFKTRPSLVVGNAEFGDIILCQVTSKRYSSKTAIILDPKDFASGGLKLASYIRPDKLLTIEPSHVHVMLGKLKSSKTKQVLRVLQDMFQPQ